MGLYPINCPGCGKPFMWFSGNRHQLCSECFVPENKDDKPTKETLDLSKTVNNEEDPLKDLVWENNQMYYVDKAGNRTARKVDMAGVQEALLQQMRRIAPKTPLKINGQEVNREDLLKKAVSNARPGTTVCSHGTPTDRRCELC